MDGVNSNHARLIYNSILEQDALPLHTVKLLAGFGKEEKACFDRALVELQMKMYLTMCARQQKLSQKGEEYGWSSTVFCTIESFWSEDVFEKAVNIEKDEAIAKYTERVRMLNPNAESKKVLRFIKG